MAALYELRARVLRAGRPLEEARFPGDEAEDTRHFGAFPKGEGRCVGVVSLMRERAGHAGVTGEMRLRGMAVEPELQGRGVGAALLRHVHQWAAETGLDLWCNARASAASFYERHGRVREGEPFDIPSIGPHYVMRWKRDASGV